MYYVYLVRKGNGKTYIGYTNDLRRRIREHKDKIPELIYYEAYLEQADALGREKYLKSGSGRRFLQAQLKYYLKKDPLLATA